MADRFAKWKREALEQATVRSKMFLQLFNRVKTDLVSLVVRKCGWRFTVMMSYKGKRRGPSKFQRIVDGTP